MGVLGDRVDAESASVLIVDDTPANLVALGAVLQPLGMRIVEARSGPEAIELVSRESFACVLLDVQMPGMDGFEVARRLRQMEAGAEVPILFLTAIHRDEEYARRGYASGAADYITKPFDPDVLRARVRAFVDLFHQRDRLRVQQLTALLERERAARLDAEAANQAKDEFLATVSHELRTPLTAILGWSMIARRGSPPAELAKVLNVIERSARSQLRIIEDLLDVARALGGKLRLEIGEARIADVIEAALMSVRPAADAKGVALEVDLEPSLGAIAADPERLQQVVWNLLSNAIKFTPGGGHVSLVATRSQSTVVVRVRDDGQGVPPQFLPHIFEPFRQADASTTRRHGGLGLGLAIVKQLVEAHGGTISARSDGEGKGTTFTVEIPARAPSPEMEAPGAVRLQVEPHEAAAGARLDGVRLLVVDDDEDSRDLIVCILQDWGASVTSASSAEEAMRLLQENLPDVILSDIGMPDVDGYALLRQVRGMPPERGGGVPAIALTAYASEADGARARAAGFQAHVTKPIDPDALTAAVAGLLGTSP
ncbi:MAG TPA: response regulator [Polyangiaceae bacterium]|nr:response regulator [Polyangiaceae bacterium]